MAEKTKIALVNGHIAEADSVILIDHAVLRVMDGERTYYISPTGWLSYEPPIGQDL